MTVKLITTIQRFQGLSTDEKPVSPNDGSTFHAIDTGDQYVYHNGMWEHDLRLTEALNVIM